MFLLKCEQLDCDRRLVIRRHECRDEQALRETLESEFREADEDCSPMGVVSIHECVLWGGTTSLVKSVIAQRKAAEAARQQKAAEAAQQEAADEALAQEQEAAMMEADKRALYARLRRSGWTAPARAAAALARAEKAEAKALLALGEAEGRTWKAEAERDEALARVAVLEAFVRAWDEYRAWQTPHLALRDHRREAALTVARAAVGEVPGE